MTTRDRGGRGDWRKHVSYSALCVKGGGYPGVIWANNPMYPGVKRRNEAARFADEPPQGVRFAQPSAAPGAVLPCVAIAPASSAARAVKAANAIAPNRRGPARQLRSLRAGMATRCCLEPSYA